MLVSAFLRAWARWRLDSAGRSALHVARNVISLLDAAAYLRDVPDDDPDLLALEAVGCFGGGAFDPGPDGIEIVKRWQLADEASAGPRDLLAELVCAANRQPGVPSQAGAAATPGIPRQGTAPELPARTS